MAVSVPFVRFSEPFVCFLPFADGRWWGVLRVLYVGDFSCFCAVWRFFELSVCIGGRWLAVSWLGVGYFCLVVCHGIVICFRSFPIFLRLSYLTAFFDSLCFLAVVSHLALICSDLC